nr:protein plastid movement impaired 1-related 1 [Tanacetum cinerariifolium]
MEKIVAMGVDVVTMAVSAINGWTTEDNTLLDRIKHTKIFKNANSGGNLIMHVSSPVVVPAEMRSGIMDVLHSLASTGIEKLSMHANKLILASIGIEKLSMHANKLMPLEDISGKTILAWASTPFLEAPDGSKRYDVGEPDPEYVSLEDLTTLAMNKIEALSIEGLRIQYGMSDKNAPSNISPQSIGEILALEGKRVHFDGSLGLEGTGGLQSSDVKNSSAGHDDDDDHGIMGNRLLGIRRFYDPRVIQIQSKDTRNARDPREAEKVIKPS